MMELGIDLFLYTVILCISITRINISKNNLYYIYIYTRTING